MRWINPISDIHWCSYVACPRCRISSTELMAMPFFARTFEEQVAINPGECAAQPRVSEKNFVAECATKFFSETGQVSCTAGCRSRLSAGRFSHMVSPEVWDKPARYRENQEWLRLRRATCEFGLIRAPSFDPMSSGQQDAFRGYLCDGGDRFLAPWFVMVPLTFSAFSHYLSRQRYCRFGFRGCRRWFTLVLYISIYLPFFPFFWTWEPQQFIQPGDNIIAKNGVGMQRLCQSWIPLRIKQKRPMGKERASRIRLAEMEEGANLVNGRSQKTHQHWK